MSARALFNSRRFDSGSSNGLTRTHHDDAALRLDAKQSPHLSQQSNRETKLFEIVVVCRHHHVDQPGYDREVKLFSEQDFQCDSRTGEVLITRLSSSTTKSLRTK